MVEISKKPEENTEIPTPPDNGEVLWEGIKKVFEAPLRKITGEIPMPRDEFLKKVVECITGKESAATVYEGIETPGEPFLVFSGTGVKNQGEMVNAFYFTEEAALWALLGAIQSYAQDREGKIHWRWLPTIEQEVLYHSKFPEHKRRKDYKRMHYYASARLVICT